MKTFFFTFGQAHRHVIDGLTLDKDVVLQVYADDYNAARQTVTRLVGVEWSMQYEDIKDVGIEHYPRGVATLPFQHTVNVPTPTKANMICCVALCIAINGDVEEMLRLTDSVLGMSPEVSPEERAETLNAFRQVVTLLQANTK